MRPWSWSVSRVAPVDGARSRAGLPRIRPLPQLLSEAASANYSGPESSDALSDITHVAYAFMPQVRRSHAPPGSEPFARGRLSG